LPLAPVRLSTMTCCPSFSESSGASARASTSAFPPAGNGTIIVMGRVGQAWANAPVGSASAPTSASTNVRHRARMMSSLSPRMLHPRS
jgi:hypothetical protein